MAQKYLLSIDGGGIRGIIPAQALVKLEQTTGKLTRETFSFAAGTSTGAIITAAVAAGVPAAKVLDLYVNRSEEIFTNSPLNIFRRFFQGYMYPTKVLHDILAEELGAAKDWNLNDSPIDVLLTAKQVPEGIPWYLVRDNPKNAGCTGRLGLVDCTTASAAAPTYFQPWSVADLSGPPPHCDPVGLLVDGGVGVAGNPVYQACVEAFYYSAEYKPEETTTVSLGTGKYANRTMPTWIYPWAAWLLDELLESPAEQQTEITWRQFPDMLFYRIDTELKQDIPLDGVKYINLLVEYGEELAETINWEAILAGTDMKFRIGPRKTTFDQYKQEVIPQKPSIPNKPPA
jgi:hypothetical protein